MGLVQEVTDVFRGTNVAGRQEEQWQIANQALADSADAISNEHYDAATASALLGLLALQLSRS